MNLTRGDPLNVKFPIIYANGESVAKEDVASIYVTFKKSPYLKEHILQKTIEQITVNKEGLYCFTIAPEETETLSYGEYVFDIEVTLTNGYRKTKVGTLTLTEETTFHGGEEDGN